jgi:hypothetical protein
LASPYFFSIGLPSDERCQYGPVRHEGKVNIETLWQPRPCAERGKTSRLHTAKILRLSEDLPMVSEIVDAEERIRTFLAAIEPMMTGGLITLEKAQVVRYGGEEEVS